MPTCRNELGLRTLVLAIWLAALMPAIAQPVRAEVRVSGPVDALTVETREASVEEVLAALRASFHLQYRTSGALNRVITGTYTGSLQRVVARLLEGHNYVIRSSASGGELIVLGPGTASSAESASGRSVVANARQPGLPPPTLSSNIGGWDGVISAGPAKTSAVPAAKSTSGAITATAPAPASAPPRPESAQQTQPDIQGWDGR